MANAAKDENAVSTLTAVSLVDGVTPIRLYADPVTHRLQVTVLSTVTVLAATGAVDGLNASFTFTQLPSYIISDHAQYMQTNSTGTTNWTWDAGTLTATMTVSPVEDIFGLA